MAGSSRLALARVVADRLSAGGTDGVALMREVAAYLVDHGMVDDADALVNDIAEEMYRQSGRLVVEVTSAHPLTESARGELVEYLRDTTQAKSVELHETVDESLIGGLVAKTPSAELDISVRNTLRQLTALA